MPHTAWKAAWSNDSILFMAHGPAPDPPWRERNSAIRRNNKKYISVLAKRYHALIQREAGKQLCYKKTVALRAVFQALRRPAGTPFRPPAGEGIPLDSAAPAAAGRRAADTPCAPDLPAVSFVSIAFVFTRTAHLDYFLAYKNDFPVAENKSVLFRRGDYLLGTQPVSPLAGQAHSTPPQPRLTGFARPLEEIIKGCTSVKSTI